MPRNLDAKPGPKSRQRKLPAKSPMDVRTFLGDGSAPEDSESERESFRSADLDNQTDYGLEFTTSRVQSPRRSRHANIASSSTARISDPQRTVPSAAQKSATATNTPTKKRRKQRNPEQRDRRFWKNVRNLQLRTDNLIPKANFARVIREILNQESTSATRITVIALEALQGAAEIYLTNLFQDAYCCTLHRGRVTLNVKDIELTRFLRGPSDPGNR